MKGAFIKILGESGNPQVLRNASEVRKKIVRILFRESYKIRHFDFPKTPSKWFNVWIWTNNSRCKILRNLESISMKWLVNKSSNWTWKVLFLKIIRQLPGDIQFRIYVSENLSHNMIISFSINSFLKNTTNNINSRKNAWTWLIIS